MSSSEDFMQEGPPEEVDSPLPQVREIILPVLMKMGEGYTQLGDAVIDPEANTMVCNFNTVAGREIMEVIGTGSVFEGLMFGGIANKSVLSNLN